MEDEPDDAERTRPPVMTDLVDLCRELNRHNAKDIVVGGMAINILSLRLLCCGKPNKPTGKKMKSIVRLSAACSKIAGNSRCRE